MIYLHGAFFDYYKSGSLNLNLILKLLSCSVIVICGCSSAVFYGFRIVGVRVCGGVET